MSNQRVIPNDSQFDVVSFTLLVDGSPIEETVQVLSISVTKEFNRIATARIVLRDGDPAEEDFPQSSGATFVPGKEIEIKVGRDRNEEGIFKGIIIKHGLSVWEDGRTLLKLECKDKSVKMTVGRKSKYFTKQKDSEVIESISKEYGLKTDVEATKDKHEELIQHHVTDWDFIITRAEANSLLVTTDDGKLIAKKPNTGASPKLSLVYGGNMLEFEAEMDARNQFKEIESSSWSYKDQAIENQSASSVSFSEPGNIKGSKLADVIGLKKYSIRHSGQVLKSEAKAWAEACLLRSRLSKIIGRAKFNGFSDLKPGDMVELQGVGDRFNGKAFVAGVKHEIVDGSWFTQVQIGLSPEFLHQKPDVVESSASGLVPGIHGLQIGKVVQLEKDPDGEDRILVKLPIVDDQAKGVWTRIASLDAGNNRGYVFRPEIDDEVVVGFLNDDPRDPIMLGMLHSSKNPSPIPAKDDNHLKGLTTRSEMHLTFDDEKKIILIDTPAGNSITISEDDTSISLVDQNGNSIVMNADGIALDSAGKITMTAATDIEIKAGTALMGESGTDLGLKAGTQFKAEGSAGAELSTGAIAVLKGSLVQIN